MGGGKKKSGKKSSGTQAQGEHKRAEPPTPLAAATPPSPPVPVKDEAALALEAAVGLYSRPVEMLSGHLSGQVLKENELCRKFDIFISSETSMPEVGIQSARDLFVEVCRQQQVVMSRFDVLTAQKGRLLDENRQIREQAMGVAEETQRGLHQKEVLSTLAEELTKQKNTLLESCQAEASKEGKERQQLSGQYMKSINELSSKLESQSALRIREAERSEALKASLRKRLQSYSKAEADFNAKIKECEAALESSKAQKKYEVVVEDAVEEDKKKKRRNKKKKNKEAGVVAGEAEVAAPAEEQTEEAKAVEEAEPVAEEAKTEEQQELDTDAQEKLREQQEEEAFQKALDKESARTEASRLHILDLVESEKKIRAQLSEYADRFERFQDALNKSNELFGGFKLRLEEMAGTIHSLEKQNRALADKEKKSESVLAGLKHEHSQSITEIGKVEKQIRQLDKLVTMLRVDNGNRRKLLEEGAVEEGSADGPSTEENKTAEDTTTSA